MRTATVGHLRAGDVVGEVGALTGLPRSATVVASSDAGALEIKREDFGRLLAAHPRLQTNLARILGARLASSNSAIRGTSHDVVALVVGMERPYLADRVLEAARLATPRPVAILDLRGASDATVRAAFAPARAVPGQACAVASVAQALEHLDRLEGTQELAILVVAASRVSSRDSWPVPTAWPRSPVATRRSRWRHACAPRAGPPISSFSAFAGTRRSRHAPSIGCAGARMSRWPPTSPGWVATSLGPSSAWRWARAAPSASLTPA